MSETEEAMRVVIMLGQLLVPGAKEVSRLLARAVAQGTKVGAQGVARGAGAVASKAKDAYETSQNAKDEAGRLGWVKRSALDGRDLMMADMPEALDREDLSAFGQACNQLGVRFAVCEVAGESRLVFEAESAEAMQAASSALLKGYRATSEETAELALAEDPKGDFRRNGADFSQTSPGTYEAAGPDNTSVRVAADGKWSVRDASGVALTPQGMPLEGKVDASKSKTAVLDAADLATAYSKTVTDKRLMAADAKAGYQTPERLAKGTTAAKVQTSVKSAAKSKVAKRVQDQAQRHAHTKRRVI